MSWVCVAVFASSAGFNNMGFLKPLLFGFEILMLKHAISYFRLQQNLLL